MALSFRPTNIPNQQQNQHHHVLVRRWGMPPPMAYAPAQEQQEQSSSSSSSSSSYNEHRAANPAALAVAKRFGVSVGTGSHSSTGQSSSGSSSATESAIRSSVRDHPSFNKHGQEERKERDAAFFFRRWMNRVLLRRTLLPGFALTGNNRDMIVGSRRGMSFRAAAVSAAAAHRLTPSSSASMVPPLLAVSWTFQRWMYRALRHRNARRCLPELLRIQRNANFNAVESVFARWRDNARAMRINAALAHLRMRCEGALIVDRVQIWRRHANRQRHNRAALRALSSSMYVSSCVLLARYFYKMRGFPAERRRRQQQAAALADLNHKRHVALTLWRWQRRLRFPSLIDNDLRSMRVRCRVALMRRYLELWLRWSCRRMTAVMLEQQNLRRLLKAYLRTWRRHTHRQRYAVPMLAVIRAAADKRLQVRDFRRWVSWVERAVLSLSLEQKTLILLLQRYFISWAKQHHGMMMVPVLRQSSAASVAASSASEYSSPPPLMFPRATRARQQEQHQHLTFDDLLSPSQQPRELSVQEVDEL